MSEKNIYEKYAPYLALGLEIAVGIGLPILLGYLLDDYLATSPWLTLAGCIIGLVNVFALIVRMNKKLNKEE